MRTSDDFDPRGLIHESYQLDRITPEECRSIFLDWVLSLEADTQTAIEHMVRRYAQDHPDHPMTQILKEGGHSMKTPLRRGGWRSRTRPPS